MLILSLETNFFFLFLPPTNLMPFSHSLYHFTFESKIRFDINLQPFLYMAFIFLLTFWYCRWCNGLPFGMRAEFKLQSYSLRSLCTNMLGYGINIPTQQPVRKKDNSEISFGLLNQEFLIVCINESLYGFTLAQQNCPHHGS